MELELTRRVQSSHIEHCGLQTLAASVGEEGWGGRRDRGRMGREEGSREDGEEEGSREDGEEEGSREDGEEEGSREDGEEEGSREDGEEEGSREDGEGGGIKGGWGGRRDKTIMNSNTIIQVWVWSYRCGCEGV